jgi:hypothetical protein
MLTNTKKENGGIVMTVIFTLIAYGLLKSLIGRDLAILVVLGVLALHYFIGKHDISFPMKIVIGFLILSLGWGWFIVLLVIYGAYKLITR